MFEIFKSAVSKIKNKEKEVHKEEVKALSSIVALLGEAASVDGNIGDEEFSNSLGVPTPLQATTTIFALCS